MGRIVGIGTDIIEIERIKRAATGRFLRRYFTDGEQKAFQAKQGNRRNEMIAANFAAKESVAKALGTGFKSFMPDSVEVLHNEAGKPIIYLHGNARKLADQLNIATFHLSLAHCKEYAVATVVAEGEDETQWISQQPAK